VEKRSNPVRVLIDNHMIEDAEVIECPECGYEIAVVGLEDDEFPDYCPKCGVELDQDDGGDGDDD
jgi:uncharacterized paraquat-inducible protein A